MRDRDSTTVPQTQLTEKTVKLILIHASVDSLNLLNSVKSAPFGENPIIFDDFHQTNTTCLANTEPLEKAKLLTNA